MERVKTVLWYCISIFTFLLPLHPQNYIKYVFSSQHSPLLKLTLLNPMLMLGNSYFWLPKLSHWMIQEAGKL